MVKANKFVPNGEQPHNVRHAAFQKNSGYASNASFALSLLLRGVLYGLGASALAVLFAYFVAQRGWDGTASALNVAGVVLWLLSGIFAWGAFDGHGQEVGDRARVGQSTTAFAWPLKDMLLALIAASVCSGLIWVGNVLILPGN